MCVWWNTHCSQFHATADKQRQWKRHRSRRASYYTSESLRTRTAVQVRERKTHSPRLLLVLVLLLLVVVPMMMMLFPFPSSHKIHCKCTSPTTPSPSPPLSQPFWICRTIFGRLNSISCVWVYELWVFVAHWLNSALTNDIYLFGKVETRYSRVCFLPYKIYNVAVWSVRFGVCHTRALRQKCASSHRFQDCTLYTNMSLYMKCFAVFCMVFRTDFYFGDSVYCLEKFCSLSHPLYVDGVGGDDRQQHCLRLVVLAADNLFVDVIFVAFSKCYCFVNPGTSFRLLLFLLFLLLAAISYIGLS